jgi:hypothetical protein
VLLTGDRPDVADGARELSGRDDLVRLRSHWCYGGVEGEFWPTANGESFGHVGGGGERLLWLWLWL